MFNVVFFYIIAGFTVLFSLLVITLRNPVHAILALIAAFLNTAIIFLMNNAEFLAMLLAIVYVGAVAVLFLFVIMMLNITTATKNNRFSKYSFSFIIFGLLFAAELYFIVKYSFSQESFLEAKQAPAIIANNIELAPVTTKPTIAVPNSVSKQKYPIDRNQDNTKQIGRILYTDFFVPFQLSGVILLLAMLGAITLTLRQRQGVRKQNVLAQNSRDPKATVKLLKVANGEGIENYHFKKK